MSELIECGAGHGVMRINVQNWGADITVIREAHWQEGNGFTPAGQQPAASVTITLGLEQLEALRTALSGGK